MRSLSDIFFCFFAVELFFSVICTEILCYKEHLKRKTKSNFCFRLRSKLCVFFFLLFLLWRFVPLFLPAIHVFFYRIIHLILGGLYVLLLLHSSCYFVSVLLIQNRNTKITKIGQTIFFCFVLSIFVHDCILPLYFIIFIL